MSGCVFSFSSKSQKFNSVQKPVKFFKLTLEPTEATVVTSDWLVGGTSAVERVGVGLASVVVGFGEVLSGLKPGGKRDPATSSKSNFSNSCGVKIANGLIAITHICL